MKILYPPLQCLPSYKFSTHTYIIYECIFVYVLYLCVVDTFLCIYVYLLICSTIWKPFFMFISISLIYELFLNIFLILPSPLLLCRYLFLGAGWYLVQMQGHWSLPYCLSLFLLLSFAQMLQETSSRKFQEILLAMQF